LSGVRNGLLLIAHGARSPDWAAPFHDVMGRIRAMRPELPAELAFLELMSPTLLEAGARLAAAGCTHAEVLPLFLGGGGHVRRDLPHLIEQLQAAHPGLRCTLHAAVGELGTVIQAMADAALALVDHDLRLGD
jgi:sirohydrochlorin cobaltochelatase